MPPLSLWNSGKKGADYKFIDRQISGYFFASGTAVYVHKYLGTHDQSGADGESSVMDIQDPLLMENRDRKYDPNVYELRGCYSIADNDFDLRQFGLFLTGDTLFIEFHMNDMIAALGRKLMSGDVLELPHQRDDATLNEGPAINKFYSITDASRASDGYSSTWYPHIWRVKVEPMTASQTYADILQGPGVNPFGVDDGVILGDVLSQVGQALQINEDVMALAQANVKARNFETRQFYVMKGDEGQGGRQNPWVYAGDGTPPNGMVPLGSGNVFPRDAQEGDYYLRTDYDPHHLFIRRDDRWQIEEIDYRRGNWTASSRLLEGFINNDKISVFKNGTTAPEKQSLYKSVKPKTDF
jgi:hypothetical protein